jgi:hypothetical protein
MNDFDVAIALRVYPGISKQPIGDFTNKFELFQISFLSLIDSIGEVSARFYVILDGCDDRYAEFILSLLSPSQVMIERTNRVGNATTFLLQMEWLLQQTFSENIYFAEDDYIYRPSMFNHMLRILQSTTTPVHFVTPHNHGDYYKHIIHQTVGTRLAFIDGLQCHLPLSTCLTFLTTKKILSQTRDVFATYRAGNFDFSIFTALVKPSVFLMPPWVLFRKKYFQKALAKAYLHTWKQVLFGKKYNLAVAIDAVGTHMQYDEVGPGVDWMTIITAYRKSLSHETNLESYQS